MAAPLNQLGARPLVGTQWQGKVQESGGAIRGLRKCVGLLLGSRDFVINGEYWMKSCLIARMECQEMPLMGSLPSQHGAAGRWNHTNCFDNRQLRNRFRFAEYNPTYSKSTE